MAGYGNEQIGYEQKKPILSARLLKLGLFVGITGALLYSLLSLVQPQYRSTTTLHLEGPQALSGTLIQREVNLLRSEPMISSFLELHSLSDDPAFNGALSRQGSLKRVSIMLGLSNDPAKVLANTRILANLQQNLNVSRGTDPRTIKIAMRSINANAAARVANKYARNYIRSFKEQNVPRSTAMSDDAQAGLLASLRDKIAASETRLATLRQDMRVNLFSSSAPALREPLMHREAQRQEASKLTLEQLSQITAQLILAKADREQAELRAKLVRDMLVGNRRIESTSTVLSSGEVLALLRKRARMEQKRSDLNVNLLPSHPQLRRINRELVALGFQIKGETKKAVANLENKVLIAAAREDSIKKSLDEMKQTFTSNDNAGQVSRLSEVQSAQPIAIDPRIAQMAMIKGLLADNRRKLLMATAQVGARSKNEKANVKEPVKVTVISPAIANNIPVFPKKLPITLLGMLAALILGLVSMVYGNKGKTPARDEVEQSDSHTSTKTPRNHAKNSTQKPREGFGIKPA
ncbi:MAG: hypothetical protein GY927_02745 [bacterium]|nr:hypothetical protein [bacterium]